MANQNRRQGELEFRVEPPQMADPTNQFGNLQFLVVRNLDDLEFARKIIPRRAGKERCRAVRVCNNDNPDSPHGACISSGYFIPEFKNIPANFFTVSHRPKIKGDDSEDNTQSSQMSLSTGIEDLSEIESSVTYKDGREQSCRRSSRTTVQSVQTDEADPKQKVGREGRANPKDESPFSTESCIQLYKRIEALEDLVRRGLDTFRKRNCHHCKERNRNKRNGQPKVTFLASDKSKQRLDGCSGVTETPVADKGKETRDIENEIQDIKKRVTALEEKMRQINILNTQSDLIEGDPSKSVTNLKKRSHRQMVSEKQNETAGQTHSGSSLHQSDIFYADTAVNEPVDWKAKNKGKKRVITTYKKVGRKSSCLLTSYKKSSDSRHNLVAGDYCPSENSTHRTRSLDSTLFSISRRSVSEKSKKATAVIYLKCQHASLAWPASKSEEKKRRKPTHLCRKIPVTNFVLSPFAERQDGTDDPRVLGDCKLPTSSGKVGHSKGESKRRSRSRHSHTGGHSSHRRHPRATISKRYSRHCSTRGDLSLRRHKIQEDGKKCNSVSKSRPVANVKESGKEGGKNKIPVLFKEICKPLEPIRKFSNVSMKVVLVENDREKSLRKLLEKLTKGQPEDRSEQYLPGARKCSCEECKCLSQRNLQQECCS